MELYIGGYAQGKLTYVRKKYPGAQIYDENSWQQTKSGMCTERVQADKPGDRDQEETDVQGDNGRIVICNHLHRIIAAELAKGKTQAEILAELLDINQRHEKVCFICDEIGNGIVPNRKGGAGLPRGNRKNSDRAGRTGRNRSPYFMWTWSVYKER